MAIFNIEMTISKKLIMTAMAAVIGSYSAMADEGMWMIHAIDAALEKKMQERGLELSAGDIYNADAPGAGIADAVVSMDFRPGTPDYQPPLRIQRYPQPQHP